MSHESKIVLKAHWLRSGGWPLCVHHVLSLAGVLIAFCTALWLPTDAQSGTGAIDSVVDIAIPAALGAHEPSLVSHDGEIYISWIEHERGQTKVMMAIGSNQTWSEPQIAHKGDDLLVNWADFSSISVFPDGTIAIHWLREIGPSSFDYRVEIALSHDRGVSWTEPLIPHTDRSFSQHGFVSLLPAGQDRMLIVWLDGRAYGRGEGGTTMLPDAMQLRATTLSSRGTLGDDVVIDQQTCSCCQTSMAATKDGTILVAYRDRTEGEIRDISVARLTQKGWQPSVIVHEDGWELAGCPVNGPAVSAYEDAAAVAWFTGADDIAAVKVAFSDDEGRSFADTSRIDTGNPIGRVDIEMLANGTAIVSWVEWIDGEEALMICHVDKKSGCTAPEVFATNAGLASINFPKMARLDQEIYIAWTQPDGSVDRLAMRRATLVNMD